LVSSIEAYDLRSSSCFSLANFARSACNKGPASDSVNAIAFPQLPHRIVGSLSISLFYPLVVTISPMANDVRVLLIDDQEIVGKAVGGMMAEHSDIDFEFCNDPLEAINVATRFSPTVILQDLMMPQIDGLTLLKFIRASPVTRDVPMIVLSSKEEPAIKAKAFSLGANDYMVKLPDKLEILARVRYHSRGYIALKQRNEAYKQLAERERQLADELKQAADYVMSLLPQPMNDPRVQIDAVFVPSIQLGGDTYGYFWVDQDHLGIYLLDVSGHGVGSSLMAVSAMNLLGSKLLPDCDFTQPIQVLNRLSNAFEMDKHAGKYFTIFYGVYNVKTRLLRWSNAAHPPPLLVAPSTTSPRTYRELDSGGPMIGLMPDTPFDPFEVTVEPNSELIVFSDGTFEIDLPDGSVLNQDTLNTFLASLSHGTDPKEPVLLRARELRQKQILNDDFSIMWIRLP
jgi:phosphoserine phosphatase RsbU/P